MHPRCPQLLYSGTSCYFCCRSSKIFRSETTNATRISDSGGTLTTSLPRSKRAILPLSVVMLLMFSIYPVRRSQASVAFVITVALINGALALGILSTAPRLFFDNEIQPITDWYVLQWSNFAYDFGFLAVGYAFMSYRGLGRPSLSRLRRLRRPPSQPREL